MIDLIDEGCCVLLRNNLFANNTLFQRIPAQGISEGKGEVRMKEPHLIDYDFSSLN